MPGAELPPSVNGVTLCGESGCTVSFPEAGMGVASGRIWGVVDCPDAVIPSQPSRICRVGGVVRFENCGE